MWKLVIACTAVIWYIILLTIGLIGWREARKRYLLKARSPLSQAPAENVEGVSILRPLKGLDPNMYENLESTFKQLYPKFEIIFSVADEHDPAIPVVGALLERYPTVDARISIGEEIVGVNPKVNNLMKPYKSAKYDILWVIDSNVYVIPDALARSVDSLLSAPDTSLFAARSSNARVGIVHHVPFAVVSAGDNSTGTRIEQAFLNTNHAKMYIALNALALDSCVMGKSNLYRRSDLEQLTGTGAPQHSTQAQHSAHNGHNAGQVEAGSVYGLAAFAPFLAEDAKIGHSIWHELNLSHSLSYDVAANVLGPMSLSAYVQRRARWIRVRKRLVLAATVLEPFTESVVAGLLAGWGARYLTHGTLNISLFFIIHTLLFLCIDLDVRFTVTSTAFSSRQEAIRFILAWAAREFLAFPIWLYAICGNEVDWRGGRYKLLNNGRTERVGESGRRWKGGDGGTTGWFAGHRQGYGSLSQTDEQ